MLLLVQAALQPPSPLIGILRERYAVALVDEFQDTDQVQWEIFRRLFTERPLECDRASSDRRIFPPVAKGIRGSIKADSVMDSRQRQGGKDGGQSEYGHIQAASETMRTGSSLWVIPNRRFTASAAPMSTCISLPVTSCPHTRLSGTVSTSIGAAYPALIHALNDLFARESGWFGDGAIQHEAIAAPDPAEVRARLYADELRSPPADAGALAGGH